MEDPARWVGLLIAVGGALLANPAATAHGFATFKLRLRHKANKIRGWLAKYIPWLRRSVTVQINSGVAITSGASGSLTVRGLGRMPDSGTLEEKIQILNERTERLHNEVGELQGSLHETEKRLRRDLNAAVADLRDEARKIQHGVDTLRLGIIHSDASALPIIVAGLVLTGLAPDAGSIPLWAGLLVLVSVVGFAVARGYAVLREWRPDDDKGDQKSYDV